MARHDGRCSAIGANASFKSRGGRQPHEGHAQGRESYSEVSCGWRARASSNEARRRLSGLVECPEAPRASCVARVDHHPQYRS
jgi:hypothetical protein